MTALKLLGFLALSAVLVYLILKYWPKNKAERKNESN